MNLNVRRWGYNTDYYDITFETGNASFKEESLDQAEVDKLAVSLIEDTLLAPISTYEVIDRLIEVGILSEEQINSWIKEQVSYD